MSVDVGLELDLDLMMGEMVAPHCESPHHVHDDCHDDGPATHYMLIGHACYGPVSQVIPVCAGYVKHWSQQRRKVFCSWCGTPLDPMQFNQVLGPVS